MGGHCEIYDMPRLPLPAKCPGTDAEMRFAAEAYLGPENVVDLDIWMAAEDFAYYTQHVEACFYRLGTATKAGALPPQYIPQPLM
jgi:metal-dependent amidase/aminoacylase/carboxypeptidase family protein